MVHIEISKQQLGGNISFLQEYGSRPRPSRAYIFFKIKIKMSQAYNFKVHAWFHCYNSGLPKSPNCYLFLKINNECLGQLIYTRLITCHNIVDNETQLKSQRNIESVRVFVRQNDKRPARPLIGWLTPTQQLAGASLVQGCNASGGNTNLK